MHKPPAQAIDADPVVVLNKLGDNPKRNEQGEVVEINLERTKITDAELVYLSGLSKLQTLQLSYTRITDAGMMHLEGMTGLKTLGLNDTRVTGSCVAELKKALPNCKITR